MRERRERRHARTMHGPRAAGVTGVRVCGRRGVVVMVVVMGRMGGVGRVDAVGVGHERVGRHGRRQRRRGRGRGGGAQARAVQGQDGRPRRQVAGGPAVVGSVVGVGVRVVGVCRMRVAVAVVVVRRMGVRRRGVGRRVRRPLRRGRIATATAAAVAAAPRGLLLVARHRRRQGALRRLRRRLRRHGLRRPLGFLGRLPLRLLLQLLLGRFGG